MSTQSAEPGNSGSYKPTPRLKAREFDLFRSLVSRCCGIKLADTKSLLMQNRLGKRLRALGIESFDAYHRFLSTPEGRRKELPNFLAVVTTNETHFFREPHHFEILKRYVLPDLANRRSSSATLRVWSAGCSTGQEVYTLAMIVDEWTKSGATRKYSILGSDINAWVLRTAEQAEYPIELRKEIPPKYLIRYVEVNDRTLTIKSVVKKHVSFRCHNFAEIPAQKPRLDIIFCRNAMMYLDNETRLRLVTVFRDSLLEGGYLILGSSESLHGLPKLFHTERIDRTLIYQKRSRIGVDA